MKRICRLCDGEKLSPLLDMGSHPIAHHFPKRAGEGEFVHPVVLSFCEDCGLSQIVDPVPAERLYGEYVCLSSWKPQPHVPRLLDLIRDLPGLIETSPILEIGCNDGDFLRALREKGFTNLFGIEPAKDAFAGLEKRGFKCIRGYFNEEMARTLLIAQGKFHLIVVRQVLEHIGDLNSFLKGVRSLLFPGGYVLIEVPDFNFSIKNRDYSAIWEEHVNYFCRNTLRRILSRHKIDVLNEETANFSGQALVVIGRLGEEPVPLKEMSPVDHEERAGMNIYRKSWDPFRRKLREFLDSHKRSGKKIAVYGAGNRACAVINFVGIKDYLDFIVDDQKEKQGKRMPGSQLPILSPEAIEKKSIDLCLLAVNAENEDNVISRYAEGKTTAVDFVSLLPPSPRLPPFWKDL